VILPIRKYRDDVLSTPAAPVTAFDDDLRRLVDDMFETMYAAPGVGLAAPQIGVSLRLFVMDCSAPERPAERVVMANPEIVETDGVQPGSEGCLSVPGIYSELPRPERVRARGQNAAGEWFEIEVDGLEARCVMHETDHLDGKLYIDRLTPLKRDIVKRKIKKLQKLGEW
jgi:peptide deformylase